jgi:phosphoribosylglycinamide formyltransferase 1
LPEQLNIAVLASGRGSNFAAIMKAIRTKQIRNAEIVLVISNNSGAGALEIARENAIPGIHVSRQQFATDDEYEWALMEVFKRHRVNFIVLAGYMKKIPSGIVRTFQHRVINIHPALLPKHGGPGMYGNYVHEAVLASRERITGATVHFVDEEYDRGPIILQRSVPVSPEDTPITLAAKVLTVEHELYPEAVQLFAEGNVKIDDEHVTILHSR